MSSSEDERFFRYRPLEDHPGWYTWNILDETRFNHAVMGPLILRIEGDKCRVRMQPERKHSNLQDMIHGGVTLSLIDVSMFAGMRTLTDNEGARAVTLELSTQFIGAGAMDKPLDSVVEVLKETRRTVFMRGIVEQDDVLIASFSGLVRKAAG
ncbi:Thioesterase superfamily protein [Tsuneonella dongtanensis]|uniref:Thioesterase superfamily protein n=1 Tax=Tsuneonella dongtanensis TaxID=692370 RepID=A0A1B2AF47_9SPHN|nr:PaaI family thioesterase [Tsuneonella dongtanensis]ANY20770.1 Thioesterase superfamily protein [Tsuneonella dongtanensis]